jgi:hypothetical protein
MYIANIQFLEPQGRLSNCLGEAGQNENRMAPGGHAPPGQTAGLPQGSRPSDPEVAGTPCGAVNSSTDGALSPRPNFLLAPVRQPGICPLCWGIPVLQTLVCGTDGSKAIGL